MSLTVGTDTYATLAEAATYIETYYTCSEEKRTAWDKLGDTDKEVYLRRATQRIDRCKFQGIKASEDQTLEFPRYYYRDPYPIYYDWDYISQSAVVPAAVKNAQIEEALELVTPGADTDNRELRSGPVKKYAVGHLSEEYGTAAAINGAAGYILNSANAVVFLQPYTDGGFRIA